jgi:soluble lytic murein transglycosylase-like protein
MRQESRFITGAKSNVGASGLMQLMPATAKWLGLKDTKQLTTPAVNIKYGVKYLKYLWDKFSDISPADLSAEDMKQKTARMAIAAYNAGQGNVRKYNDVPPFKETRSYVTKVTEYFNRFDKLL